MTNEIKKLDILRSELNFSVLLKMHRLKKGYTHEQISKTTGIPVSSLLDLENDIEEPTLAQFIILSELFGYKSLDDFITKNMNRKAEKYTDEEMKRIAAALRKYRIERRLSQNRAARKIGINQSYYCKFENANGEKLTFARLDLIAKFYNVHVNDLLYNRDLSYASAKVNDKNRKSAVNMNGE